MDKVQLVVKNVPRNTRDRFKATCALKGVSMQVEIVRLIEAAIKEALEKGKK